MRHVDPSIDWDVVVIPAIGCLLVVLTLLSLPLRARFEFVRSDFDSYAKDVLAAAEDAGPAETTSPEARELLHADVPDSIGGFSLDRAELVSEGLLLFDREGSFLGEAGFAYFPDGQIPSGRGSLDQTSFRSLGGGWYAFTLSI